MHKWELKKLKKNVYKNQHIDEQNDDEMVFIVLLIIVFIYYFFTIFLHELFKQIFLNIESFYYICRLHI